ncbi:MAG: L-lactate dehydrogenase [Oscillospiraceae bacterium]|nr:L-lactate dehydrogenase [Candidatus Ruminococcus equi]
MSDKRKVVLVGTGMVGMSFAYAALNQNVCDELVLIDINRKRAMGEAMDLNHGLAFSHTSMRIYDGEYSDCCDADIVVICAGVNQKPGESRLDLLSRNTEVFRSIVEPVVKSGFCGIFLVATNPVDIMTRITYELSKFPESRVIGTGTTLDTARLRYLMSKYFHIDPRNIHAYVIGEHGDSEFCPWSQALIATKPIYDVLYDNAELYSMEGLEKISEQVRTSAQQIIEAKGATYYGIGMSIVRIVKAILQNENAVLTVSTKMSGEYGIEDVFLGNPCTINRGGKDRTLELSLDEEEMKKLYNSANILKDNFNSIKKGREALTR